MDSTELQARVEILLAHERELFELVIITRSPILRANYLLDLDATRRKIILYQKEQID
jgi:hypothetical protein